jgi:hypothetical protein
VNPTPKDYESMAASVRARYLNSGFLETESKINNLLRFQNKFSEHFVFLFDSFEDLVENWEEKHNILVQVYQDYTGPESMEWNFYAIFMCEDYSPDEAQADAKHHIEMDTAYSRKFVFTRPEIDFLPPGRITQADFGRATRRESGLIANWQNALGEELLRGLVDCHKTDIRDLIKGYIRQRKRGN